MLEFDSKALRTALGSYMTGVTIVTALAPDGTAVGFTANSFTSVSLNPPLLLVCPGNHLSSFDVFANARHFAVNILSEGQEDLSNRFASSRDDRFSNIKWRPDPNGVPLLDGVAAQFSCSTRQAIDAGDHIVLLGLIQGFHAHNKPGLGYCSDGYFSLGTERQSEATADPGQKILSGALVECDGKLCVVRHPDGLHLPMISVGDRSGARTAIEQHLQQIGLEARLGPVYSSYDDQTTGQHITIFRAVAKLAPKSAEFELIPISDLHPSALCAPANPTMIDRFKTEHGHNYFGLYIGDAIRGEVHHNHVAH